MRFLRLDKYLADAGLGSRSQVRQMIRRGDVTVDKRPVKDPAFSLDPSLSVEYQGRLLASHPLTCYLFYKPAGCVCAARDGAHPTIFNYIPQTRKKDLFSVGRLDLDTEGLLLVTNDGVLGHRLVSPRMHVDKTYYAEVNGHLAAEDVRAFAHGLDIGEKKPLEAANLKILCNRADRSDPPVSIVAEEWELEPWTNHDHATGDACAYVTIHEGKFHQIKRMFAKRGHELTYLKRLRMGPLVLDPSLAPGQYRPLSKEESDLVRSGESSYF